MIGRHLSHYTVVERLGQGGMGVVYKGRDTHLDRFVALKVLPQDRVASDDARRRFIQEAKSASALNHPNIVTVHDIATDGDVTFIAMELVPGRTLAEIVPRQGLPLARLLAIAIQIADGLAAAHRAGIVHRDLKPGNVMVGDDGRVKLLDFGLAKLIEQQPGGEPDAATRTISDITDAGLIVGTAGYMSPEQAEGRPVDARSDIFSFGVLLYEMVTGRKPFAGDTPLRTLSSILKDTPPSVVEIAPGCPPELSRIIDRCLRKDPDRRWQHVQDVRIALLELKEESDSGRLAVAPLQQPARASVRGKAWAVAAATAIVAAAVPTWWLLTRGRAVETAPVEFASTPLTTYQGDERDPSFSPDALRLLDARQQGADRRRGIAAGSSDGVDRRRNEENGGRSAREQVRELRRPHFPRREDRGGPVHRQGRTAPLHRSARSWLRRGRRAEAHHVGRLAGRELRVDAGQPRRTIYFVSWRSGDRRAYSMSATGGQARELAAVGTVSSPPLESPDGQWVYFRTVEGLSRVRPAGGAHEVVVKDRVGSFRPTTKGIFYLTPAADMQSATLKLAPLDGGIARVLGTLPRPVGGSGLSLAPDFSRLLYARCDQCAADIMLVENFR